MKEISTCKHSAPKAPTIPYYVTVELIGRSLDWALYFSYCSSGMHCTVLIDP